MFPVTTAYMTDSNGDQMMMTSRSKTSILSTADCNVSDVGYLSSSDTILSDTTGQHSSLMISPINKTRVCYELSADENFDPLKTCLLQRTLHKDSSLVSQKQTVYRNKKPDAAPENKNIKYFKMIPETPIEILFKLGEQNVCPSSAMKFSNLPSKSVMGFNQTYNALTMNLKLHVCSQENNSNETKTVVDFKPCPHFRCYTRYSSQRGNQVLECPRKSKSDLSFFCKNRNDSHYRNSCDVVTESNVELQQQTIGSCKYQCEQQKLIQNDRRPRITTYEQEKSQIVSQPKTAPQAVQKNDVKAPEKFHVQYCSPSKFTMFKKSLNSTSTVLVKKAVLKCITEKSIDSKRSHPAVSKTSEKQKFSRRLSRVVGTSSAKLAVSSLAGQKMSDQTRRYSRVSGSSDPKSNEKTKEITSAKGIVANSVKTGYNDEYTTGSSEKNVQLDKKAIILKPSENANLKPQYRGNDCRTRDYSFRCHSKCYNDIYKATLMENFKNRDLKNCKKPERDTKEKVSIPAIPSESCLKEVPNSGCSHEQSSLTATDNNLKAFNSDIVGAVTERGTTLNGQLSAGDDKESKTEVEQANEIHLTDALSVEKMHTHSCNEIQLCPDNSSECLHSSRVDHFKETSESFMATEDNNPESLETNTAEVQTEAESALHLKAEDENPCKNLQNEAKGNLETINQASQGKPIVKQSLQSFIKSQLVGNNLEEGRSSDNLGVQLGTKLNDIVRSVLSFLRQKDSDLRSSEQMPQGIPSYLQHCKAGRLNSVLQSNSPKTLTEVSFEQSGSTTQSITSLEIEPSPPLTQSISNKLASCFSPTLDNSLSGHHYLEALSECSTISYTSDACDELLDKPLLEGGPSLVPRTSALLVAINEVKEGDQRDSQKNISMSPETGIKKVNLEERVKENRNNPLMVHNKHKHETNVKKTAMLREKSTNPQTNRLPEKPTEKVYSRPIRLNNPDNSINIIENQTLDAAKGKQYNRMTDSFEQFDSLDRDNALSHLQQASTFSMQFTHLKDIKRRFGRQGSDVLMTGSDTSLAILNKVSQPSTIRRYQAGRFAVSTGHNQLEINREKEKISCRCAAIHSILTDLKHHILLDRISDQRYGSTSQYLPDLNFHDERWLSSEPSISAKPMEYLTSIDRPNKPTDLCATLVDRPNKCTDHSAALNILPKEFPFLKSKASNLMSTADKSEPSESNITDSIQLIASIIKENAISPREVLKALGYEENQITIAKKDSFKKKTKNDRRSFVENYCRQLIEDWQRKHSEEKTKGSQTKTVDKVLECRDKSRQYGNHVDNQYLDIPSSEIKSKKTKMSDIAWTTKQRDDREDVQTMERFNTKSNKVLESKNVIHLIHQFQNMSTRELLEFALCNRSNDDINKLVVREVYKRASRKRTGIKNKSQLRQGAVQLFFLLSKRSISSQSESLENLLCPETISKENSLTGNIKKLEQRGDMKGVSAGSYSQRGEMKGMSADSYSQRGEAKGVSADSYSQRGEMKGMSADSYSQRGEMKGMSADKYSQRGELKGVAADPYSIMKEEFKERVKENQRIINQWSFPSLKNFRAGKGINNDGASKLKASKLYKPAPYTDIVQQEKKRHCEENVLNFKRNSVKKIMVSSTSPKLSESSAQEIGRYSQYKTRTPTQSSLNKMNNGPSATFTFPVTRLSNKKCVNTDGVAVCYLRTSDGCKEVTISDPKVADDSCKDIENLKTAPRHVAETGDHSREIGWQNNTELMSISDLLGDTCDKQPKGKLKTKILDERIAAVALQKSKTREQPLCMDGDCVGRPIVANHFAIQTNYDTFLVPGTQYILVNNDKHVRLSKKTLDCGVGHDDVKIFVDASANTDSCNGETSDGLSHLEYNKKDARDVSKPYSESAPQSYGETNEVAKVRTYWRNLAKDNNLKQIMKFRDLEKETEENMVEHNSALNINSDKNVIEKVYKLKPIVELKCSDVLPLSFQTVHIYGDQEKKLSSATKVLLSGEETTLTAIEVNLKTLAGKAEHELVKAEPNEYKCNTCNDHVDDMLVLESTFQRFNRNTEDGLGMPVLDKDSSYQLIGGIQLVKRKELDNGDKGQEYNCEIEEKTFLKGAVCGDCPLLSRVNEDKTSIGKERIPFSSLSVKNVQKTLVDAEACKTRVKADMDVSAELTITDDLRKKLNSSEKPPLNPKFTDHKIDSTKQVDVNNAIVSSGETCHNGIKDVQIFPTHNLEDCDLLDVQSRERKTRSVEEMIKYFLTGLDDTKKESIVEDRFTSVFSINNKGLDTLVTDNLYNPLHLKEENGACNGLLGTHLACNPTNSSEKTVIIDLNSQSVERFSHLQLKSEVSGDDGTVCQGSPRSVKNRDTIIVIEEVPEERIAFIDQSYTGFPVFNRPKPEDIAQFNSCGSNVPTFFQETNRNDALYRAESLSIVPTMKQSHYLGDALQKLPEINSTKLCPSAYLEEPVVSRCASGGFCMGATEAFTFNRDISRIAENEYQSQETSSRVEQNGQYTNPFRMFSGKQNRPERYKYIQYVSPLVHSVPSRKTDQGHQIIYPMESLYIHGQQELRANPINVCGMEPVRATNIDTPLATTLPMNPWKLTHEHRDQANTANLFSDQANMDDVYNNQVILDNLKDTKSEIENRCKPSNHTPSMQSTQLLCHQVYTLDNGSQQGEGVNMFNTGSSIQVKSGAIAYQNLNLTLHSHKTNILEVYDLDKRCEPRCVPRDRTDMADHENETSQLDGAKGGVDSTLENANVYYSTINSTNFQYTPIVNEHENQVRLFQCTHLPSISIEQKNDALTQILHDGLYQEYPSNKTIEQINPKCLSYASCIQQLTLDVQNCGHVDLANPVNPLNDQLQDPYKIFLPKRQVATLCNYEDNSKLSVEQGIGQTKDGSKLLVQQGIAQTNIGSKLSVEQGIGQTNDGSKLSVEQGIGQTNDNSKLSVEQGIGQTNDGSKLSIKQGIGQTNADVDINGTESNLTHFNAIVQNQFDHTEVTVYVKPLLQSNHIVQSNPTDHKHEWTKPVCYYALPNKATSRSEIASTLSMTDTLNQTRSFTTFYSESTETCIKSEPIYHQQHRERFFEQIHQQHTESFSEPIHQRHTELFSEPIYQRHTELFSEPIHQRHTEQLSEPIHQRHTEPLFEPIHQRHTELLNEPIHQWHTELLSEPIHQRHSELFSESINEPHWGQFSEPIHQQNEESFSETIHQENTESFSELLHMQYTEPVSEPMDIQHKEPVSEPIHMQHTEPVSELIYIQHTEPVSEPIHMQHTEPVSEPIHMQHMESASVLIHLQNEQPLSEPIHQQHAEILSDSMYEQHMEPFSDYLDIKLKNQVYHQENPARPRCIDTFKKSLSSPTVDVKHLDRYKPPTLKNECTDQICSGQFIKLHNYGKYKSYADKDSTDIQQCTSLKAPPDSLRSHSNMITDYSQELHTLKYNSGEKRQAITIKSGRCSLSEQSLCNTPCQGLLVFESLDLALQNSQAFDQMNTAYLESKEALSDSTVRHNCDISSDFTKQSLNTGGAYGCKIVKKNDEHVKLLPPIAARDKIVTSLSLGDTSDLYPKPLINQCDSDQTICISSVKDKVSEVTPKSKKYFSLTSPTVSSRSSCKQVSLQSDRYEIFTTPKISPKRVELQLLSKVSDLKKIFMESHSPRQNDSDFKSSSSSKVESISVDSTETCSAVRSNRNKSIILKDSLPQTINYGRVGQAVGEDKRLSKPNITKTGSVTNDIDPKSSFLKHTLSSIQKIYVPGNQENQSIYPKCTRLEPQISSLQAPKSNPKLRSLSLPIELTTTSCNNISEKSSEVIIVTSNCRPCILLTNDQENVDCQNNTTKGLSKKCEKTPTLKVPSYLKSKTPSPVSLSSSLSSSPKQSSADGRLCHSNLFVIKQEPRLVSYSNVVCLNGISESSSELTIKSTCGINGEDSSSADELDSAEEPLEAEKAMVKRSGSCSLSDSFHSCNSAIQ